MAPNDVFRANFFRVVMRESVAVCDAATCDYGCWSATDASPPNFHVTPYFGVLVLG